MSAKHILLLSMSHMKSQRGNDLTLSPILNYCSGAIAEEIGIRSRSFFVLYKMAKKVHSLKSCSVNSQLEQRFQYLGVSHNPSGERLGFSGEAEI